MKKEDAARFLKNDWAVGMLNFNVGTSAFTAAQYRTIGDFILNGKIKVVQKNMKAGIEAEYIHAKNTLAFKPGFTLGKIESQMTFIHECTHAIIDMQKVGKHHFATEEASAFIAEALFSMYKNLTSVVPNPKGTIFDAVIPIVQRMAIDGNKDADIDLVFELVLAIENHPTYKKHKTYDSDGI